jgi:hypothetical protein
MKTLAILLLLAGSVNARETPLVTAEAVKSTLLISAPRLEYGDEYGEVLISVNGSNLDPTPIASNKWLVKVPLGMSDGEFSAIIYGRGRSIPMTCSWVVAVPGKDISDVISAGIAGCAVGGPYPLLLF